MIIKDNFFFPKLLFLLEEKLNYLMSSIYFFVSKSVTRAILLNPADVITAITSTTLPYDKTSSALINIFLSFLY